MSGSASTVVQFTPPPNAAFRFPITLENPTVNAAGTGPNYTAVITWNIVGDGGRWYFNVVDQNNTRVLTKPLIGSDEAYGISLVAGYFSTTVYFYPDSSTFVIT